MPLSYKQQTRSSTLLCPTKKIKEVPMSSKSDAYNSIVIAKESIKDGNTGTNRALIAIAKSLLVIAAAIKENKLPV